MAALTADNLTRVHASGGTRYRTGALKANAIIYYGALIAKDANGLIVAASDAAAIKVCGVAQASADNTGGADAAKTVVYVTGLDVELDNAGGAIVQASDKGFCYVADDHSVTTAAVAVNDVIVGIVASFTAAKVWVYVDEVIGPTGP